MHKWWEEALFVVAWVLVVFALCGAFSKADAEGLYLELGFGHDFQLAAGDNPQSVIRARYEFTDNSWWRPDVLEWNHHSSITDGIPFNMNAEDPTDQFSIIWRFKLK